ncbi:MAG TPA: tRNA (adenosine(37)-N6)-dimethylallyltransferase MiaA [Candidatus Sulfomarinibacteraceae bacterium]|nr:tRNA (adenosine(37)-N6)-dimethylallyltransferase MiaA [Candidatus Sulfomarinibacteraceae bacterium]
MEGRSTSIRPGDGKSPLLVVVGPTAIGKTDLSLRLARRFDGEIVSADSRLFYQGMDVGTAKPSPAERAAIPHHLIDIAGPDETITLGQYQDLAYAAIDEIQARGRLPILVGGTGQYIMAVVEGWGIPRVAPHPALRRALRQRGGEELHRWLQHLDPPAAARIHPNNVRRVVRALEVTLVSGRPITELQRKTPRPYDICIIGLNTDRDTLYRRIDERVERMMATGLLEETQALQEAGYDPRLPALSGLGYRQLLDYLAGEMTLQEAVERIKFETHRFVRHQNNWFQEEDPRICWFDISEDDYQEQVHHRVAAWLRLAASHREGEEEDNEL